MKIPTSGAPISWKNFMPWALGNNDEDKHQIFDVTDVTDISTQYLSNSKYMAR